MGRRIREEKRREEREKKKKEEEEREREDWSWCFFREREQQNSFCPLLKSWKAVIKTMYNCVSIEIGAVDTFRFYLLI